MNPVNPAISLISQVSDSLREPRFVRLECAFFTPPLTAAAYSRLQCRRGASQTSLFPHCRTRNLIPTPDPI